MSEAFESIKRGMLEAVEYSKGRPVGAVTHEYEPIDVRSIREKVGMSPTAFAAVIGVRLETLRAWEQGQRYPRGPALVLLQVIDIKPSILLDTIVERSSAAA